MNPMQTRLTCLPARQGFFITLLLIFLLVSAGILRAQVTFHPEDLDQIVQSEHKAHQAHFRPVVPESPRGYDVKWYGCNWIIDPAVREITGSVTTLFTALTPAPDTLGFDLHSALTVDSVLYHGQQVAWTHTANLVAVILPEAVSPGVNDSVTIWYHGVPPDDGFGSFAQMLHNGIPVIWTLSEPYGSSDWWPCKNGLTDKADSVDIFIRTPVAYKAASNGLLLSETPAGQDMVFHWKHRYPIAPYLVCVAVTNYARYTHKVPFEGDTLDVVNYIYPEDSAAVSQETGIIIPLIQLFDTLFGVYPFQTEKYGHTQFGWGGGMEHQTMTFVSSFGFELLAHELAHQWFGDQVTCGSWTDIWLNEGFATYLSGLCYEHMMPELWKRFREVRVKGIVSNPAGSVYCSDTTSVGRIFDGRLSYAKGALILHQLRWHVGDEAFFSAMNNYRTDPAISYGFARTNQFKAHLEATSGRDLTGYFADWFTGEGYPSYLIGWEQRNDTVRFIVNQSQSHPSVSFFEMEIPVQFKNATRDTIIRFSNTHQDQVFTTLIPFAVDSLVFDPDFQQISGNNSVSGIAHHDRPGGILVFPNPARSEITFLFGNQAGTGAGILTIVDSSGKKMAERPVGKNETSVTVQTGKFSDGWHTYSYWQGSRERSGKFLVSH